MKFSILFLLFALQIGNAQLSGLTMVHSHNDYLRDVPFWEAFENNANSIEVDIFLQNDSLFVTHGESEIVSGKTIEELYLKPMLKAFSVEKENDRILQLLVDIKSEAKPTLDQLITTLGQFKELTQNKRISFVISGNRPLNKTYTNYPEYIYFDYQSLDDLADPELWKKVKIISLPFHKYINWDGKSSISDEEYTKVKEIVAKAHSYNKPFRFWATPDIKLAWKTLAQLGVDYINTNKPSDCAMYIEKLKRVHH